MKAKCLWLIGKCHEFMDILKQRNLVSGFVFQSVEIVLYRISVVQRLNFPDEVLHNLNFSDQVRENMLSSNIYWIWYSGRGQGAGRLGQW